MNIGANVRARRRHLGWSQYDLADKSGITQAQISRLESSKSENVTIENLRSLAKALGCSVVDLLPDEDKRTVLGKRKVVEEDAGEDLTIEALARRIGELEKRLGPG